MKVRVRRWIKFDGDFWIITITPTGVTMKKRGAHQESAVTRTWGQVLADPHQELPLFPKEKPHADDPIFPG